MQFIYHRNLSVTSRDSHNRVNFASGLVVAELRPENVIRRNNVFERRLDHFFWRCRNYIEGEAVAVKALFEELRQLPNVLLEANSFAHLDKLLFANTTVFRFVKKQLSKFASLLH